MGNAAAIEYVTLTSQNFQRRFVVTVAPNSMAPKDEMSERNQAIQLAEGGWLDPINLFKALNDADPINTAKMVTMFRVNPMLYMQTFFPEQAGMMQPQMGGQPQPNGGAPPGPPTPQPGSQPEASPALSQVPIQPLPK